MAHKAGDKIQIKGLTYVYGDNEELTLESVVKPSPVIDNKVLAELEKKTNNSQLQPVSITELPLGDGAASEVKQNEIIIAINNFKVAVMGYLTSTNIMMTFGDKESGVDEGTVGLISIGDDYIYLCTTEGTAETTLGANDGTAVWKKSMLFNT